MTRWVPAFGYEDCYAVSDDGQMARTTTHGGKPKWKLIAPRPKRDGYITFHLCKAGQRKDVPVAPLMWKSFNGPIPPHLQVDHKDSDRTHNRLENFRLLTQAENVRRAWTEKRRLSPLRKFTADEVREVISILKKGLTRDFAAAKFGVSKTCIRKIDIGETYLEVLRDQVSSCAETKQL